jgi:hypothetical protein
VIAGFVAGPGPSHAWDDGTYHEFLPTTARSADDAITSRSAGPLLKLATTSVHRPRLNPREEASLRAQYTVVAPSGPLEVVETRVITYNGSVVTTLRRVVSRAAGIAGSEYRLRVPADAAEGWYTATTILESPADAVRGPVVQDRGVTPFYVKSAPVADVPAAPPGAGAPVSLRLWTDKPLYRVGETLRIHFEANRDAYLMLVNVGTSGRITVLFPNRFSGGHQVKAGRTYSIPTSEAGYALSVGGPPGVELVYGVLTSTPVHFIDSDFSRTRGIFLSPEDLNGFTRDINIVAKQVPRAEQATAVLELRVDP